MYTLGVGCPRTGGHELRPYRAVCSGGFFIFTQDGKRESHMKSRVFLTSLAVAGSAVLVGQLSAKSSQSLSLAVEQNEGNLLNGENIYDIWPCNIQDLRSFGAPQGTYPEGTIGLAFETKGANAGNYFLPWVLSPDVDHPVIGMNLYRINAEGRIEQIGLSWLKHAWAAVQGSGCGQCQSGGNSRRLAPGCADTYGESLNADQQWLGPRWEITPEQHKWMDGTSWIGSHFQVNGNGGGSDTSSHNGVMHRLRVQMGDLTTAGAQYWIEGFYHILRDYTDPNWNDLFEFPDRQFNNTTHRQVTVNHGGGINFTFGNVGSTADGPIIYEWASQTGGTFDRAAPVDEGVAYVASRAVDLGGGEWRYEYAIYNLNVSRELDSVCVPVGGATVSDGDMHFPVDGYYIDNSNFVNESPYGIDPWGFVKDGPNAVFTAAAPFGGLLPNTIRFGTTYTFWFTADAPPASSDRIIELGMGGGDEVLTAAVVAPGVSEQAILTDVAVETGTLLGGGLSDLLVSDNAYLHARSGFGMTFIDAHNTTIRVDAHTDAHATNLNLTIEDRIDEPAGSAAVALFDWNTGVYDSVGGYALGMTDQVHAINGVQAPDYVSVDGTIRVRIKHRVFVPFLAFTFESFVDEVRIEVE